MNLFQARNRVCCDLATFIGRRSDYTFDKQRNIIVTTSYQDEYIPEKVATRNSDDWRVW